MYPIRRLAKHAVRSCIPNAIKRGSLALGLFEVRQDLLEKYIERNGNSVQGGPFQGMELLTHPSWDHGTRLQKLIGCYEAELHPTLLQVARRNYKIALNIGCAEGYYAVGAARLLLSQPPVFAFDARKTAQSVCIEAARKNQVIDQVKVGGPCTIDTLDQLLRFGDRSLIIIDSEGDELKLLRPDILPGLRASDLIIECHDWVQPGLTAELEQRFSPTHNVEVIFEGARDIRDFPFLAELTGFERAVALCEFRPRLAHWLFCTALA